MPAIRDIGYDELQAGLADGSLLVVDVREERELAGGMIPGSVSMPLSRFDPERLPAEGAPRVVFSCAAGVRSQTAIAMAQAAGLDLCEHYPGGFIGWIRAGGAVASSET